MKKLIIFFSALALIGSCAKVEMTEPVQDNQSNNSDALYDCPPEVLYASVVDEQDSETRTYVDGKTVMWHPGDIISHFYGSRTNAPYIYNGETPASNVKLEYYRDIDVGGLGDGVNYSRSVYPYDPQTTITVEDGIDKINVNYPTTQTYATNSFGRGANLMIATGDSYLSEDVQHFRNACGYLVIKLYGKANVKSITLSAVDGVGKIAGNATIVTDENKIPVTTMSDEASSYVTLDCSNGGQGVALGADAEHSTEFWFALPPVEIKGGIRIVVTDMNGNRFTKHTTKDVDIIRNEIQPMAALEFVSNTPAANKIWYTKVEDSPIGTITFGNGQTNPFDATIGAHYYDSSVGKWVIDFKTPVKTIKANAFNGTAIQTIVLPDGLETIEEGAFAYTQIQSITIPGSVNTIKAEAFGLCGQLKSIDFLPSPTQTPLTISCTQRDLADYGPFQNASFTSIKLNRELNYVDTDGDLFIPDQDDEGIFYNIHPAASATVTIGNQVKTLSKCLFCGLKFQSLTIPGLLTEICDDVFNECTALKSLTFEPSPTGAPLIIGVNWRGVEEGIFVDCPLETFNLNRQLEYSSGPQYGLFSGNSLGDGITLGEQVHTLLPYMFTESGITSLTIPATVMNIEDYAFYNCKNLSSIRFEGGTEELTIGFQPGNTVSNDVGPFYQSQLTNIYVNREIVASEQYARKRDQTDEGIFSTSFDDAVVTVTLQGNVKTISDYMFSGVNMQTIWIPREVTSIGESAFEGCSQLYGVTLAHSTPPTLGAYAFDGTLLQNKDKTRWIALEDATNIESFKTATNWSEYKDIIKAQIKK